MCASAKVGNGRVSPQPWLQGGARVGGTLLFTFPSGAPFPLDSFREPTKDGKLSPCFLGIPQLAAPNLHLSSPLGPACYPAAPSPRKAAIPELCLSPRVLP